MVNNDEGCYRLYKFIEENGEFLNNPLIKDFLSSRKNYMLFKQAICQPTSYNKEQLDIAFRTFYFHIRFTSYVSSTIYFHGINIDKNIRKTNFRFPLTLDKPVSNDSDLSYKDLAEYIDDYEIESDNILDYISDPDLYRALQVISPKQREVLYLVYIKGYNDTEVGYLLNKSQQAVSKTRNKALKKIRLKMEESQEFL